MINPKFIEFTTKDGLTLPGLLYKARMSDKIAIYLHGNGSSSIFYNETKNRALANILNERKISILFFNNRGAHLIKKLNVNKNGKVERKLYGMAYEKIKECVKDIDGAIGFLRKLDYKEFYLIGVSTGANKVCVYNFYKPKNKIAKYVLLNSGDDAGFYYSMLGRIKFKKLLSKARRKIKTGHGDKVMPEMLPYDFIFSYNGFYDIANPDGDYNIFPFYEVIKKMELSRKPLFRHFNSITKPALVIYGELDEYAWGDAERMINILKDYKPNFTYKIIKGANHKFDNHEAQLAKIIARWVSLN